MTSPEPSSCPQCGAAGGGKFCSSCGAPRAHALCPACGTALSPGARFCSGCGWAAGSPTRAPSRDRTPWIVAGAALAGLLAAILVMLARQSPTVALAEPESLPAEAAPDISNMSPRERFNRLYNRVMEAAQGGDQATAARFTPMALMAYAQLDTIDADARYHAALLKIHTGEVEGSRALGDSILTQTPGHLFGYIVQGTVARFRKDQKDLSRAYGGFLKHYDAETAAARPEYQDHRTSVDDFHKAALEGKSGRASGS